jgi:hypothetical protein
VTSLLGTLLHFLYDWLGGAAWIAPFSGINESTWEHMKLLFWPMLLYAVVQSFFFRERENFWCVKCRGILLGIGLIPILFYTYNGVIGKSPDWINIAIFFLSAATVYFYEARQLKKDDTSCHPKKRAILLLSTVAALFVIFTFLTPQIGIFRDPLTGAYGR